MNDPRESSRRLADLLRREHAALGDFLVALADFDHQRLWLRLGYPNLFEFLRRELGLSRGAAHYRKVAARLVQKFPEVVEPLRDGRLCLSSILALARVLTEANRTETLPRFFHCSKQEANAVAVGILPAAVIPRREVVTTLPLPAARPEPEVHPDERAAPPTAAAAARDVTVALTPDLHRLHMTVSRQFLDKLDRARAGQSHAQPGASREQVLEAALDLMLEQQARRRAEVKRPQENPRPASPGHVTAATRRAVWARDQGKCQWPVDGGGVCGSTLRLEVDHVVPRGRGGPSTVDNCRLTCRVHNDLAARQVYGDEWMDLFTGRAGEEEAPAWRGAAGSRPAASPHEAADRRLESRRARGRAVPALIARPAVGQADAHGQVGDHPGSGEQRGTSRPRGGSRKHARLDVAPRTGAREGPAPGLGAHHCPPHGRGPGQRTRAL